MTHDEDTMNDSTLDIREIRDGMMRLWRDTFHDSLEYVNLIFDNYFSPENVAYHCEDGKVVAALIAIPYDFVSKGKHLKSAYLCGLATHPKYRNRGVMRRLMDEMAGRLKERGVTLAFLIPASESLVRYYQIAGWSQAIYRVREHFTEVHDFTSDIEDKKNGENVSVTRIEYSGENDTSVENIKFSNLIADYLRRYETEEEYAVLRHDPKSMEVVLHENHIGGGEVWIARGEGHALKGVAFMMYTESPDPVLEIRYIVADSESIEKRILSTIEKSHKGIPLTVFRFPECVDREVLWQPYYGAEDPKVPLAGVVAEAEKVYDVRHNAEVYGMAMILDPHEILKFAGVDPESPEYSNLVAHPRELQSILFRRPDSSVLIGEVFHLPRIPLNMALLLD